MKGIKAFCKKNAAIITIISLLAFVIRLPLLAQSGRGIDTVEFINAPEGYYAAWNMVGRFGLTFISRLYHPYLNGILTMITFILSAFLLMYLWDRAVAERESFSFGIIVPIMMILAHPVLTEQLYFGLQSFGVCLAYILVTASVLITGTMLISDDKEREKSGKTCLEPRRMCYACVSVFLLVIAFSVYQSFCEVYIFEVLSILLLRSFNGKGRLKEAISYALTFIAGFAFYLITARIISGGSSYFGGEVRWGKYPISENLRGLAGAIFKSMTGYNSVHYNFSYGLILILAAILLLIRKREASGIGARTWLYAIATVFSPYLLTLVSGGYSPIRAKLAFPLCVAFWAYMCMFLCRQVNVRFKKIISIAVILVCISGIISEICITERLYYTAKEVIRMEDDLVHDIALRVDEVADGEDVPILFIGKQEFEGNELCIQGEVMGYSHFEWDTDVPPRYYKSSERIVSLFNILGHDYRIIEDLPLLTDVDELTKDMPVWPSAGSVSKIDETIIVKLSD